MTAGLRAIIGAGSHYNGVQEETSIALSPTRFDDGHAYERMMGRWSRLAGTVFLDWLNLPQGLCWLDVGCGNGAFTEMIVARCAPAAVHGIDPSTGQLAVARSRCGDGIAKFHQGDAQALPFENDVFDAATMALVINLVPAPAKAVAEMTRVVRPGGCVASYMWDLPAGGFTMEPIRAALAQMGVPTPIYGAEVTSMESQRSLWQRAGLDDVAVRRIDIRLTYADFDDFWETNTGIPNTVSKAIGTLLPAQKQELKDRLRARLCSRADGPISYDAWANAVRGRVAS